MNVIWTYENYIKEQIRPRPNDAHKGSCGRVLVVCGSLGMTGAAIMCAKAALRSGAGLVTVAVPVYLFHIVQTAVPEATCIDADRLDLVNLNLYDAIAFGPGLGRKLDVYRQLEHVMLSYRGPIIIDADGLNCLADYAVAPGFEERPAADLSGASNMEADLTIDPADAEGIRAAKAAEADDLEGIAGGDAAKVASDTTQAAATEDGYAAQPDAVSAATVSDAHETDDAQGAGTEKPVLDGLGPVPVRRTSILPDMIAKRQGDVILTPHPGEADRLLESLDEPRYHELTREQTAEILARRTGAIVVLKGSGTLIADGTSLSPDRQADLEDSAIWMNPTGGPGMATGGSGDVLTGVTAALAAYGQAQARENKHRDVPEKAVLAPADAARTAVYIHGLAGDIAASHVGEIGMTAMDIIDALPGAFRKITGR